MESYNKNKQPVTKNTANFRSRRLQKASKGQNATKTQCLAPNTSICTFLSTRQHHPSLPAQLHTKCGVRGARHCVFVAFRMLIMIDITYFCSLSFIIRLSYIYEARFGLKVVVYLWHLRVEVMGCFDGWEAAVHGYSSGCRACHACSYSHVLMACLNDVRIGPVVQLENMFI